MKKLFSNRGEITTALAVGSLLMMSAGAVTGTYIIQKGTKNIGKAAVNNRASGQIACSANCRSKDDGSYNFCYSECIDNQPGFSREIGCRNSGDETYPAEWVKSDQKEDIKCARSQAKCDDQPYANKDCSRPAEYGPCKLNDRKYDCVKDKACPESNSTGMGVGIPYWCDGKDWYSMNTYGECTGQCSPKGEVEITPAIPKPKISPTDDTMPSIITDEGSIKVSVSVQTHGKKYKSVTAYLCPLLDQNDTTSENQSACVHKVIFSSSESITQDSSYDYTFNNLIAGNYYIVGSYLMNSPYDDSYYLFSHRDKSCPDGPEGASDIDCVVTASIPATNQALIIDLEKYEIQPTEPPRQFKPITIKYQLKVCDSDDRTKCPYVYPLEAANLKLDKKNGDSYNFPQWHLLSYNNYYEENKLPDPQFGDDRIAQFEEGDIRLEQGKLYTATPTFTYNIQPKTIFSNKKSKIYTGLLEEWRDKIPDFEKKLYNLDFYIQCTYTSDNFSFWPNADPNQKEWVIQDDVLKKITIGNIDYSNCDLIDSKKGIGYVYTQSILPQSYTPLSFLNVVNGKKNGGFYANEVSKYIHKAYHSNHLHAQYCNPYNRECLKGQNLP